MGDVWYGVRDFFSTSHAESQRNKYRSLVKYLSGKIGEIDSDIQQAEDMLAQCHRCYMSSDGGINKGHMIDVFYDKEDQVNRLGKDIIGSMKTAKNSLRGKLSTAREKQSYWQAKVDQEDREKKLYTGS